jgi:hypothetical protein
VQITISSQKSPAEPAFIVAHATKSAYAPQPLTTVNPVSDVVHPSRGPACSHTTGVDTTSVIPSQS